MGRVRRDGINRLRHALGYSRYYSTICVTLSDTGWAAGVGAKRGVDLREIDEHSDLVVIWGGNPVNTQVNVMSHAMAAKRRGAPLVVVDPYRTDTAAKADLHLAPRPGTDGALACAVMHVLFAEGLADWDYLRAHTDCPDELAAHVAARPPAPAPGLGAPPVTAMLVQNTNPAMVCPETHLVRRGLAREDLFLCVHEQFLTETAAFADIVLPATMMVEHDDFYTASGHTYFQVAKKVIDPPAECRENHWVICQLAKRLGAAHPGFQMSAWEIMDETLRKSGMWDAETNWRQGWQDFAPPFETAHFLDGFPTPDRRFHFKAAS